MWKFFAVYFIIVILPLEVLAQVFGKNDTIRLRDTSIMITPIEHSQVAKRERGIKESDDLDEKNNSDNRSDFSNVKKSGFISQTVSNGNNRDMSQNIVTDFYVETQTVGGITISAEVKDYDMPFDSEGVTNQVSELSQVLISAKKDSSELTFGDIVVSYDENRLMKFSKKTKGVNFSGVYQVLENDTFVVKTCFSSTKGKYRRVQLNGYDNSQGPYYLKSESTELSVIVLQNTETVWLDGILMTRNSDYTVDYNAGTITFEINHIITSQSVITVDYEYSETLYDNYLIFADTKFFTERYSIETGFLTNFDALPNENDSIADDSLTQKPISDKYFFVNGSVKLPKNVILNLESAFRKSVSNKFLAKENSNNSAATNFGLKKRFQFLDSLKYLEVSADYKLLSKNFSPIEVDKDAEFNFKWSLDDYNYGNREDWLSGGINFVTQNTSTKYSVGKMKIGDDVEGNYNVLNFALKKNKIENNLLLEFYDNSVNNEIKDYLYGKLEWFYKQDSLIFGLSVVNSSRTEADSNLLNYRELMFSIKRNFDVGFWKLSTGNRKNFDQFFAGDGNNIFTTIGETEIKNDDFDFSAIVVYRYNNDDLKTNYLKNTLSSKIDFNSKFFDKQLSVSFSHQSEYGNQEQMAYKFIKTSAGNGYYIWNDYNGDGVEDVDEFEVSYYKAEADYVKYFVHTGQYVNTKKNDFSVNLVFKGNESENFNSAFLSRLEQRISLIYNNKSAIKDNVFFRGDSLINGNFYRKYFTKFTILDWLYLGIDFSNNDNENFTYYGSEKLKNTKDICFVKLIWNCGLSLDCKYFTGLMSNISEGFANRDYNIKSTGTIDDLLYEFGRGWQLGGGVTIEYKKNTVDNASATVNSVRFLSKFVSSDRGEVTANYKIVDVNYIAKPNVGTSEYQMSEGLGVGINNVLNIDLGYKITKYLRLNICYEMRKSRFLPIVHTGNVELRMEF